MHKHTKFKIICSALILLIPALVFIFSKFPKQDSSSQSRQGQVLAKNQDSQSATIEQTATPTEAALAKTLEPVQPSPVQSLPNKVLGGIPNPVTLRLPSISLTAPIIKTGLEEDGSLRVPSSPDQTGWYTFGPKPGEVGPAVITGHYDSKLGPGALYNLKNVKPGDEISVVRDDGSIAIFKVDRFELYPQDNFATQEVYGSINTAGLRIITCAGTYNKITKRYSHNLVVYATLTKIIQPEQYNPL